MNMACTKIIPVTKNGRLNLPAEMRRAIGLSGAGYLVLTLDGDEIRITTREQMLKQVRDLVSPYKPEHELASEQLIQDRRNEVKHEDEEWQGVRHG